MKIPLKGPTLDELFQDQEIMASLRRILGNGNQKLGPEIKGRYLHWDQLRHKTPPEGLNHKEWWFGVKYARAQLLKQTPLIDKEGVQFRYAVTDGVLRRIHRIDRDASGKIEISEQVTNPEMRDRYIVNSLIQEAITSSQLEGAATTAERAKEMIRTGRRPTDRSEQMILNNFEAMRLVREYKTEPLTPDLVLELQEVLTKDTLDDPGAVGRYRTDEDDIVVTDAYGTILHRPPGEEELEARMDKMCLFANDSSEDEFVHPVIRAIILHFWLAFDHPFVDGNGRTARALFYWAMLSQGYWLCEYISISRILRGAPAQYARSFLYTETDENDLTYFLSYQLEVIVRAIQELHKYLQKKIAEVRQVEALIWQSAELNHRQLALLSHALKHPNARYTIKSHQRSHNVVYQTARTDLLQLVEKDLVQKKKIGRTHYFYPRPDLAGTLKELGSEA